MGVESWNVFTNLEGVTVVTAENIFSIFSNFLRGSDKIDMCCESLRIQPSLFESSRLMPGNLQYFIGVMNMFEVWQSVGTGGGIVL